MLLRRLVDLKRRKTHMTNNRSALTTTENGDIAYCTAGDVFLDLFSTVGGSRNNLKVVKPLFNKALNIDLRKSIALMLYTRDIKNGLGEREVFRCMYEILGNKNPIIAAKMIETVVNYGRYDDILSLIDTEAQPYLIKHLKKTLKNDRKNQKSNISLLSKWLPSVNCHNKQRKALGKKIANLLGMTEKSYRKCLSTLRKGRIIENDLRKMDYSFDYQKVPSLAINKYREAFKRNDGVRYQEFISNVKKGKTKLHTDTLYPYDIIRTYSSEMCEIDQEMMEAKWKNMKMSLPELKNTIVVRDGSGSMCSNNKHPLNVSTSLAILFSEYLGGELKNSFITFSSNPEIVNLDKCNNLCEKLKLTYKYNDCSNTNILKVYNLIAKKEKNMNKDEQIKRIIIISDMEFDYGVADVPTYETFKQIFADKGLIIPQVIYINVCSHSIHFAATKDDQVILISGASKNLVSLLNNTTDFTPLSLMNKALNPYYQVVDKILGGKK